MDPGRRRREDYGQCGVFLAICLRDFPVVVRIDNMWSGRLHRLTCRYFFPNLCGLRCETKEGGSVGVEM